MRALAVRLMHLGKTVYVVGETSTPSITGADLLILGSGSGRTAGLLTMADQARHLGVKILLFTTDAASPLAELADHSGHYSGAIAQISRGIIRSHIGATHGHPIRTIPFDSMR